MIDIHHCPDCDAHTMDSSMVCQICGFPYVDRYQIAREVIREYVKHWQTGKPHISYSIPGISLWLDQQENE